MLSFLAIAGSAAAYNVSYSNVSTSNVSTHNVSTSTEIVTAYTTFCPEPTTFVEGTQTYTVTAPTTLTVTNCPCTRTHTYSTSTVTVCPSSTGVLGPQAPVNSSVPAIANEGNKPGLSMAAAMGALVLANFL